MAEYATVADLLNDKLILVMASALFGIIATIITQRWLNRRAIFVYSVFHSQIGLSAEDAVYGSVRITWNNTPAYRLYLSTIELTNESTRDFESITVRAFTNNTKLLKEKTSVVGTTRIVEYTDGYNQKIAVAKGAQPTEVQVNLYYHQKEYIIPTMNRGQTIRFEFLNEAESEEQPEIWLDVLHKGVRCKFKPLQDQFMGVAKPTATLVGNMIGMLAVGLILIFAENTLTAAIFSYIIGVTVVLPGIYAIKVHRKIRNWFIG